MSCSEQRKTFMEFSPGAFAPGNRSGIAASCRAKHITQITETVYNLKNTVTHGHFTDRTAVDRADPRLF